MMAVKWSWAWGDGTVETPAVMISDMGFAYSSTNVANTIIDSTYTYSYTGSPTRYALRMDAFMTVDAPTGIVDTQGWVATPVYVSASTGLVINRKFIRLHGPATEIYCMVSSATTAASGVELYVANVLKATSSTFNWASAWNYIALKFDATADPWAASVWVNDAEVISNQTESETISPGFELQLMACSGGDRKWCIGQIVVYGLAADVGGTPRFCTRINPTADLTEVGTWTQSTGSANYAVVAGPFDVASYTVESTAVSADAFACTAGVLSTLLGVTPTAIDAVTAHDWSTGGGITVYASVGESTGPTYTDGAAITPLASTSYAFATATVNPSTSAAWAPSQTVVVKHSVT